ncbi:MAG: methylmalonyl-CoA mutase family protein [Bacteroidota bacterium]
MTNQPLSFRDEFPDQALTEWEALLSKSLKGQSPEHLNWQAEPGLSLPPFLTKDALDYPTHWTGSEPGESPFLRGVHAGNNHWQMVQEISLDAPEAASRTQEARATGVYGFLLSGEQVSAEVWQQLDLDACAVHLDLEEAPILTTTDLRMIHQLQGGKADRITGTLYNDPISTSAAKGKTPNAADWSRCEGGLKNTASLPHFRGLGLDLRYVHEQGGGATHELAFALSTIVEYLDWLGEFGHEVPELLKNLAVTFGVGNRFFVEMAKFRAFRVLMSQLLTAYGIEAEAEYMPFVLGQTSQRLQTSEQTLDHLLPATTQAMSTILGGVDALIVRAHDSTGGVESAESARLARNVQQLLRHETHLHQVQDPAGGSYYVETATYQLAQQAWELFQTLEQSGGFQANVKNGRVQGLIQAFSQLQSDISNS